jgi:hypothetical protein
VIKVFWDPEELQSALDAMGWEAQVHNRGVLRRVS